METTGAIRFRESLQAAARQVRCRLAVLDLISSGRAILVAGVGYMPSEYHRFNVPTGHKGALTSRYVELIRRALSGERFEFDGREIFVRPRPVQEPHPPIWIAGSVAASAKRAARLGDGFLPHSNFETLIPLYREECATLGKQPGPIMKPLPPLAIHIAEDPEAGWRAFGPHAMHVVASYAAWATEGSGGGSPWPALRTVDELRASGFVQVLTPDEAARHIGNLDPDGTIVPIYPLFGGLHPDQGWQSLHLLVDKVIPELQQRSAVSAGYLGGW